MSAASSCNNVEGNTKSCNCTYDPCPRKGICCECVAYHRSHRQLPACFFPTDAERTYDRSYRKFIEVMSYRWTD